MRRRTGTRSARCGSRRRRGRGSRRARSARSRAIDLAQAAASSPSGWNSFATMRMPTAKSSPTATRTARSTSRGNACGPRGRRRTRPCAGCRAARGTGAADSRGPCGSRRRRSRPAVRAPADVAHAPTSSRMSRRVISRSSRARSTARVCVTAHTRREDRPVRRAAPGHRGGSAARRRARPPRGPRPSSARFASTDSGRKASWKSRIEPDGCTKWLPAMNRPHPPSARRTKYAVSRSDSTRSEYCFECAVCMIRLGTVMPPIRSGANSLEVAAVCCSSGTTAD